MDLYREEILEHWQNPQNFGVIGNADVVIDQVNPLCGDEVTFYFKLNQRSKIKNQNQGGSRQVQTIIDEVRFTGSGCAISIASASLLSQVIKGKSIDKISEITGQDVLGLIGGPVGPARLKCAFLSLEAVRKIADKSEVRKEGLVKR